MKSEFITFSKLLGSVIVAGTLTACASAPIANIDANANVDDEVRRLSGDINQGYIDQLDVTSQSDFDDARAKLDDAKKEISDKGKREDILMDLRESRGYLNRAIGYSNDVVPKAQGILDARNAALAAGARTFPSESAGLTLADNDFRSEVDKLQSGKLNSRRWSELQAEYMNLEIRTIQDAKLGEPQARVAKAIDDGARSYAPHVLKRAEWDLQNARNVIATDRHNSSAITPAVVRANTSSQFLTEVVKATHAGRVEEHAAIQLVKDNRNIAVLKSDLNEKTDEIFDDSQQLRDQQAEISLDQALNHARKQFKPNEAEVYRQGDKLLIRLKGANFQTGRASLNKDSLALMQKVQTITANLHPQQVVIEGNTDSTGSPSTNLKLSQNRADSVASFFESKGMNKNKIETVGMGPKKPLASNETKTGRAQNRRVDILVTPSNTSEASQSIPDTEM